MGLKLGTRLNIVGLRKIVGDRLVLFERGSRVGISKIGLHEQQTEFFCGRIENAHLKTKGLSFLQSPGFHERDDGRLAESFVERAIVDCQIRTPSNIGGVA